MPIEGTLHRRRVYLMRHGEVDYFNADGQPVDPRQLRLTETGRQQALAAGETLASIVFDRVISSGMPRATETAQLALGSRENVIEAIERFQEIRAGRLRDLPEPEIERRIAYAFDYADESESSFINGERFSDFENRVLTAWQDVLSDDAWDRLLLVAHEGVNRAILSWVAGVGREGMMRFDQDSGCYNVIDIDMRDGEVTRCFIKSLNITPYNLAKKDMHFSNMEQVYRKYRNK